MAGNLGLGDERVHDPAKVTFPGVRRPAQQRPARATQQASLLQCRKGSHDRGGVAGDDARAVPVQRTRIGRFRNEGVSGHLVILATLDDELDAPLSIDVDVHRRDPFRRAVHHQVARLKQIIEVPGDIESGVPHRLCMVTGGCEKAVTLLRRHAWPPVGADIRNPGQFHIVLQRNGVGDTP